MSQRDIKSIGGAIFQQPGQDGLIHRGFLRGGGFTKEDVRRQPVIGIANSASELNPCNAGLDQLVSEVKAGVREMGGLPLEFPTISISEPFTRPTSLYLRNLMSMDVEEMIHTAPIDGVVLLGGCDKTVPAQLMGAISAGKPAAMCVAGPRPTSCFCGKAFTIDDLWPLCQARDAGEVSDAQWQELEGAMNIDVGTCNVMGTATSMAAIAEALGFALPGSTLPEAPSAARRELARATGRRAVELVRDGVAPRELVSLESLENAFRLIGALGGSSNTIIHLEAIAGRAGLEIGFERFDAWAKSSEYVTQVRPGGPYLLADLQAAGGIPAVMHRIRSSLHLACLAGDGRPWQALLDELVPADDGKVIASAGEPFGRTGGIVMLRGNLAPSGAVLKQSGVHDARLRRHKGRAVVFDGMEDLNRRIDDPELDVDADSVLVLRGLGPVGAPGMPEVGHIPIPAKLWKRGVRDMVRISDARMSGTSSGTVVLHMAPEAAAGGAIGQLQTGDLVELDSDRGVIRHFLTPEVLQQRPPYPVPTPPRRGFGWLHQQHVLQADQGCDFDFLRAS